MHKCINNSVGNVYHLEQMVDNFFPYSQKQLGFDQDVSIVFQSDEDNASRMLGKTAYYDPEGFAITLYTDSRHPKDIMRSLSHELVHHAQNCRGEFKAPSALGAGYAQNDPHLRKMEREAYTKGNLIFRDFEDLIKTGKINIEIDFSDSGEPKMSLKEWKNNEINTKLMKKWGLLKEVVEEDSEEPTEDELEEGCGYRNEDDELEENSANWAKIAGEEDPTDLPPGNAELDRIAIAQANRGAQGSDKKRKKPLFAKGGQNKASGVRVGGVVGENANGKISVREAKEITRRIIERIKKENN